MISGIFQISCGDHLLEIKADTAALEAIECRAVKKPATQILEDIVNGRWYVTDIINIVHVGLLRNKDTRRSKVEIGDLLMADGIINHLDVVSNYLVFATTGKTHLDAEEVPETEKK